MNRDKLTIALATDVIDADGIYHGTITGEGVYVYGNKARLRELLTKLISEVEEATSFGDESLDVTYL